MVEVHSDQIQFIYWVIVCCLSVITGILQIYGLYGFIQVQHVLIIQKRYPVLIITECIVGIIACFITIPLVSNTQFHAITFGAQQELVHIISYSGLPMISHAMINLEAGRLWLMSFSLHYLHSAKNKQWISQIDQSFADKDWYILNKATYGNPKYIITRVFVYYIIAATISTAGFLYFHHDNLWMAQFIDALLFGLPISFTIYIYYKSPKYGEDNFLYAYEFKLSAILFTTALIAYLGNQILFLFGFELIIYLLSWIIFLWAIMPSLLSVLWIPNKILADAMWRQSILNLVNIEDKEQSTTDRLSL